MSKQVLKRVSPHTSVWVDEEDETMNNKKQSSVEWLFEQMIKYELFPEIIHFNNVLFHQAKAMHKEEIEESFECGYSSGYKDNGEDGKQYYNETFGGQDNE